MTDPTSPDGPERFADDAQRYRLAARIATGGMGEVWSATDTVLGRTVAVKILKAEYADDATFRSRFETEARNAAALHHPNVAGIFDFGQSTSTDGSATPRPYLVMELVEGQPLSALLRAGEPMDPQIVSDLMAQAADGIGAAHRAGIVHRDIKPANLLVTRDRTLKITDFGIARAGDNVALTQTGMVMGTPQYISPEQAQGMTAGPAADIYSLGVVAYECLAGRRPFVAETAVATALAHLREPVPDLPPTVPAPLAAVVVRALQKKPEDRYADGAAFARALRDPSAAGAAGATGAMGAAGADDSTQVMTGVGAPVPAPVPVPQRDPEPTGPVAPVDPEDEPKKRPVLPWVAGALALLLVGLLIYLFVATGPGDDTDDANDDPTTSATSEPPPTTETSEPPPTSETSEPTTFDLDPGEFRGLTLDDVTRTLEDDYGLSVRPNELTNDGGEVPSTVEDVSPTSGLTAGDSVTVDYWGPEPEPEPEPEPTPDPTTDAPPSSEPTTGLPSELPTDTETTTQP
ncbi:serine/threonine-protein kinase [Nocardioides zeae]|uniref:non-specific serine/threonine protein kinase n=1 Tax=Nocardioides imazamoxiresistens TaxID=3231893 RepID=A0ABU3PV42_9ACTN|nr:serine/threonine-protein kinase [Nocardioides zeae]MDT9593039.1 serine/threonine-protein kinase [Nocardioides zeae]